MWSLIPPAVVSFPLWRVLAGPFLLAEADPSGNTAPRAADVATQVAANVSASLSPAARIAGQIVELFVLAIPIACVAWTVTHEEIFREPRDFCARRCKECRGFVSRKFFYLFTCEYCFSHYVAAAILVLTGFKLLHDDWRGYLLSFFSLVWVANVYMNLYGRLRVELRSERTQIQASEKQIQKIDNEINGTTSRGDGQEKVEAGKDGQGSS